MMLAPLVLVGLAVFTFIGGQVVMRLWNWLTPPLFNWPTITFWQAVSSYDIRRDSVDLTVGWRTAEGIRHPGGADAKPGGRSPCPV